MNKRRVALNGYGVIGRRVADAVALQEDMELVGVSDIVSDYRIRMAEQRGYAIYASVPDKAGEMRNAGINVRGTLDDLLKQVEVVIDCTPKGIDAKNKPKYDAAGVKSIGARRIDERLLGEMWTGLPGSENSVLSAFRAS